jgi:DNA-binding transcriptional LysR family regulator
MYDVRRLALLHDLSVFGTLIAVAEANGITASAVSQQMRRLETEAGVELLIRQGRRVRLTGAGEILVTHAAEIIASLQRAEGVLSDIRDGAAGQVLIGAYPSIMGPVGSQLALALRQSNADLDVRLIGTDAARVLPALLGGEFDVALVLRYNEPSSPLPASIGIRDLFPERFVAVVPSSLSADVEEKGLLAMRDSDWIMGAQEYPCTQSVLSACNHAGFAPNVRHQEVGYQSAVDLVAAGLGVAVIPELSVPSPPPAGISILPCAVPSRSVAVLYRRGTEARAVTASVLRSASGLQPTARPIQAVG